MIPKIGQNDLFGKDGISFALRMALIEVLKSANFESVPLVIGNEKVLISGMVDVLERAMPKDLLLLSADGLEEDLLGALEEADSREASALVLTSPKPQECHMKVKELFEGFQSKHLEAVVVLEKTRSFDFVTPKLAQGFFGTAAQVKMKIAVVGGNEQEVRAASWILFKILEVHAGASKTGLLNDRCSLLAQSNLGIFGSLTVCAVEEMLAGMAEAAVDFVVAEVLPSTRAFDHVKFDLLLDLGGCDIDLGEASEVIRPNAGGSSSRESPTYSHVTRWKVESLDENSLNKLKVVELKKKIELLGGEPPDKRCKKAELVEQIIELSKGDGPEPDDKKLVSVFQAVKPDGLELHFSGLKMEETVLHLPFLGFCSPKCVTAAICAGAHIIQNEATIEVARECLQCLPSIPPPATLEVIKPSKVSVLGISVLGILQEVSSPNEMKEVLKTVTSLKEKASRLTAVFGCDGAVSRGDRAKYAWALAEQCDRIVLTSASPGTEPPMQIIEDMLDAVRGFRKWNAEKESMPSEQEIFVVVDRADAIKLGTITRDRPSLEPDLTLVFGSGHKDFYEAPDVDGEVRSWLCNDRRLLTEAVNIAEEMRDEETKPPWTEKLNLKKSALLPGRSLHWSYGLCVISTMSKSEVVELL